MFADPESDPVKTGPTGPVATDGPAMSCAVVFQSLEPYLYSPAQSPQVPWGGGGGAIEYFFD